MIETRRCNVCGESWYDTGGDMECLFCGSVDTYIDEELPPNSQLERAKQEPIIPAIEIMP